MKLGTPTRRNFRLVSEGGRRCDIEIPVQVDTSSTDEKQGMFDYYYHITAADHPHLFGIELEPGDEWHIDNMPGFPSITIWRDFPWEESRLVIR